MIAVPGSIFRRRELGVEIPFFHHLRLYAAGSIQKPAFWLVRLSNCQQLVHQRPHPRMVMLLDKIGFDTRSGGKPPVTIG